MKEFVLVEFVAKGEDQFQLIVRLNGLGDDFQQLNFQSEWEEEDTVHEDFVRITGRISSEIATMLKLQDGFLADRMRISYISDELKDKYRR